MCRNHTQDIHVRATTRSTLVANIAGSLMVSTRGRLAALAGRGSTSTRVATVSTLANSTSTRATTTPTPTRPARRSSRRASKPHARQTCPCHDTVHPGCEHCWLTDGFDARPSRWRSPVAAQPAHGEGGSTSGRGGRLNQRVGRCGSTIGWGGGGWLDQPEARQDRYRCTWGSAFLGVFALKPSPMARIFQSPPARLRTAIATPVKGIPPARVYRASSAPVVSSMRRQ